MSFMINAKILRQEAEPTRRRVPRQGVAFETQVRELGATAVEARLLNISEQGFMAETLAEIAPGVRVWLLLPGHERANALVRWAHDGRFGAEFAVPIETDAVLSGMGAITTH